LQYLLVSSIEITFFLSTGVFGLLGLTIQTLPPLVEAASFSFGAREEMIAELGRHVHGHPALVKVYLKKALRLCSD
jgi:hypothetical protein